MTKKESKKVGLRRACRIESGKANPVFGILWEIRDTLATVKVGIDEYRTVPLGHIRIVKG